MSTDTSDKRFRDLTPGVGGTFRYNDEVRPIGIRKCETTLGISFRIDSMRIFCAHLQFNGTGKNEVLSDDEGSMLRSQVHEKLTNLSKTDAWEINNGRLGHDALIVSQQILSESASGHTTRYPAWYMIRGFRDFFMDCKMKLGEVMGKLLKFYPEAADDMFVFPEKRTRIHDFGKQITSDIQMLGWSFGNVILAADIIGFVVDGNYARNNLFYLDANGRAAHAEGFDLGKRVQCKYVATQIIGPDIAPSMHSGTKGKGPQGENWSFSV